MYSFDAAIRGYHYYRKYWQPEVNQKLYLSDERANAFDVFSIKASNAEGKIVGHLPMKVSRITKFLMDHGARWTATLRTTQYHKSPLIQGGLEIPCSVDVYMISSTVLSRKLTQRYTKLVEDFYMEPMVVLVPLLRHQLLLLISIFPLLPKAKAEEKIPREKICKSKRNEKVLSLRTLEASLEAQLL